MTTSYVRGPLATDWPIGTTVTPAEFAGLDSNARSGIDGYAGGTYTPINQIVIGGAGIETTDFRAESGFFLNGISTGGGAVDIDGSLLSNGDTVIGTDATDTMTVHATATFNNDVVIGSTAADECTVNATTTFNNNVTIGSSSADVVVLNSTGTLNANLHETAIGRFIPRAIFVTSYPTTISAYYSKIFLSGVTVPGGEYVNITYSGSVDGEVMELIAEPALDFPGGILVKFNGVSSLYTVGGQRSGGEQRERHLYLMWSSGTWLPFGSTTLA